jgi:hypothetical protein
MLESPRLASESAIAFLLCVVLYVITVGTQSQKLDSFLPLVTVERTSVVSDPTPEGLGLRAAPLMSRETNDHAVSRRQRLLRLPLAPAAGAQLSMLP